MRAKVNAMNPEKIINTLGFYALMQDDKTINCMKAYKLIWLADRYHLRKYGRTITGDSYFAMQKGVVPSAAKSIVEGLPLKDIEGYDYSAIQENKDNFTYTFKKDIDKDCFSQSDIEVLQLIWNTYGNMTQWQLSNLSHQFPEWKAYKQKIDDVNSKNSFNINMDLFFENYDDGSGLFVDDKESMDLAKEMFHLYK